MLLLKIAITLWLISEVLKYYLLATSWKTAFWYVKARYFVETLSIATFFVFLYTFVIDMATGEMQLYNLILELSQHVGGT